MVDQLRTVIKGACRKLPDDDVNRVVNHLISKVGVNDMEDLNDVTEDMLKEIPSLGTLHISRLLKAFTSDELCNFFK